MTNWPSLTAQRFKHWRTNGVWVREVGLALLLAIPMFALTAQTAFSNPLFLLPLILLSASRQIAPEVVTILVAAICLIMLLADAFSTTHTVKAPALLIPMVVHASIGYGFSRTWGNWVLGGALGGILLWLLISNPTLRNPAHLLVAAVGCATVLAAFLYGKQHRDRMEREIERDAEAAERIRLLEIERDQRAEVTAATERTTIAREVHDIVAHSLSVIIVQADGGRAAAQGKPEVALEVLDTIADTGRAALAEMRRIVGVLRDPQAETEFAPTPGAADIPDLVASVTAAGLDVTLAMTGELADVPMPISLTMYRVVQESLTNVIKHAGPQPHVEVTVTADGREISATILDNGLGAQAAPPAPGGGNGLRGMRERVGLVDGSVIAAPRAGGGFLVAARVPLPRMVGQETE